jgi:galactoside O-acetyltransferase
MKITKIIDKVNEKGVIKASKIIFRKLRVFFSKILHLLIQWPRIIKYKLLSRGSVNGYQPIINQPILINGQGTVYCQRNVSFGVIFSPGTYSNYGYIDVRRPFAKVKIGCNVVINNNCCLICNSTKISIGENTCIGINTTILDSDFHSIDPTDRKNKKPGLDEPVSIGKNVFIGNNVTILKGVKIGNNSIIAAGSIVNYNIPGNVIAAGNPCLVKKII